MTTRGQSYHKYMQTSTKRHSFLIKRHKTTKRMQKHYRDTQKQRDTKWTQTNAKLTHTRDINRGDTEGHTTTRRPRQLPPRVTKWQLLLHKVTSNTEKHTCTKRHLQRDATSQEKVKWLHVNAELKRGRYTCLCPGTACFMLHELK